MASETKLYDLLDVAPTASASEIKKAFRKLALKHHPDRGGDGALFQELSAAHSVLSDARKREVYDAYGAADLKVLEQGGDPAAASMARSARGGGASSSDAFRFLVACSVAPPRGGSAEAKGAAPRGGRRTPRSS